MNVSVLMGLPGSGKSSFAQLARENGDPNYCWGTPLNPPVEVINPDSIRRALTGDASNQSRNSEVFDLAHSRLRWLMAMNARFDTEIIFDATNVKKDSRLSILSICAEYEVKPDLIVVETPLHICMERMRERKRRKDRTEIEAIKNCIVVVPDHAMERMHREFTASMLQIKDEGWANIHTISGDPEREEGYGYYAQYAGRLSAIYS